MSAASPPTRANRYPRNDVVRATNSSRTPSVRSRRSACAAAAKASRKPPPHASALEAEEAALRGPPISDRALRAGRPRSRERAWSQRKSRSTQPAGRLGARSTSLEGGANVWRPASAHDLREFGTFPARGTGQIERRALSEGVTMAAIRHRKDHRIASSASSGSVRPTWDSRSRALDKGILAIARRPAAYGWPGGAPWSPRVARPLCRRKRHKDGRAVAAGVAGVAIGLAVALLARRARR